MSKYGYPLELLREERRLLKSNVDGYDPENNYYEDDDLPRWKRLIKELDAAISVLEDEL